MTAYLSANLRHTDKRLQQSGPAVVTLRHRVRARRGAKLMNIYTVGGDMTCCCLPVPRHPAVFFCLADAFECPHLHEAFSMYISSFTLLYAYSLISRTPIHKHNNRCGLFTPKRKHAARIIRTLCASKQAKRVKILIIKIETQINHLHIQLYSNDPPRQKGSIKDV